MKEEILAEASYIGKVRRIGNSKGMMIPAEIIEYMHLTEGSIVDVRISLPKTRTIESGDGDE